MTKQPLATISYNTNEFLTELLESLIHKKIISFYAFINHLGEYDEKLKWQDKNHSHLYLIPNGRIDPMDLKDMFKEADPEHILPLWVQNFRTSNWDDWLLYEMHDKDYLNSKGETRQFYYSIDDFFYSNYDEFMTMASKTYHSSSAYAKNKNIVNFLDHGGSLSEMVRAGGVSPSQATGYYYFDMLLKSGRQRQGTFIERNLNDVQYVK